jgi:hypothetical protein
VIETSRDDVVCLSPSPPGPVVGLSSVGDIAHEWGSGDFRPTWGLSTPPPHPAKLPVESLFTEQYEGQLPFSYLRPADFYSRRSGKRRSGERFDPKQGVEDSSVSSSGIAKDERASTGDSFSSSSVVTTDVPRGDSNGEHGDDQLSSSSVVPNSIRGIHDGEHGHGEHGSNTLDTTSDHGTSAFFRSSAALKTSSSRPLNHLDSAAHHSCLQILNPPDSDDSEDEELTDAELIEAIVESTCINTVDLFGEAAISKLVSNPAFTILRTGTSTALVLFPDRSFRVFWICDVDEAYDRLWTSAHPSFSTQHDKYEAAVALQPHGSNSSLRSESSDASPRTAKKQGAIATKQGSNAEEDAEFDSLLEAQRVEDLVIPAEESTHLQQQKREVLSDHDYRLRKERTDSLLEGYRSVTLRRSPRLRG